MSSASGGNSNDTQGTIINPASAQTISFGPGAADASGVMQADDAALAKALATIPNYQIEKKLGEGGMGAVYRAHQKNLQRTVAIKVLPQRLCNNTTYVARLNREAVALAKITHPNVIGCYDLGEHEGMRYVVMEYVEGENLGSLIETRKTLPQNEALYYLKQAVMGLDCALSLGIIHRDIKPENMLLAKPRTNATTVRMNTAGYTLKIADLGLATFTSEETENTRLTAEGSTLGSPHYMSPEQTVGESDLDFRTDQYALGITLYHMVSGNLPFTANTIGAVLARKLSESIPDPRKDRKELAPSISLLIQKMTARKKEDRYANYGELLQDIENIEQKRPLTVVPLPPEKASLELLPETLAALKKEGVSISAGSGGSAGGQAGIAGRVARGAGIFIWRSVTHFVLSLIGLVVVLVGLGVIGKVTVGGGSSSTSTTPPVVTVTPTPPVVPVQPDKHPTPPTATESFATQILLSKDGWNYHGEAKDFVLEDGALYVQSIKGWNRVERALPATEYVLQAAIQIPNVADECEVHVGIGEKDYIACGIRYPTDAKTVTAYVERRETKTDKVITSVAEQTNLGVDDPQQFYLLISDGGVTCKLNNKLLCAPAFDDTAIKSKLLRLAARNGVARFSTLVISPKPVTK